MITAITATTPENWLHVFLFGIYPYIALTVFILGCWARFDLSQYSWKTGSSQMLNDKGMRIASNLFHIGIIVVLLGHFFGMLTPHFVYERIITAPQKQLLAVIVGGIAGVMCLVGLLMLIWRRFTDPRVSHTSTLVIRCYLSSFWCNCSWGLARFFLIHNTKMGLLCCRLQVGLKTLPSCDLSMQRLW